jgi:hypothetical protein
MSMKVLEMEHHSPYRGYVRETWREGSFTEDSDRYVMERSGNAAFPHKGKLRYFAKEGLANMFTKLCYCP